MTNKELRATLLLMGFTVDERFEHSPCRKGRVTIFTFVSLDAGKLESTRYEVRHKQVFGHANESTKCTWHITPQDVLSKLEQLWEDYDDC